jgi:hypothetical protein
MGESARQFSSYAYQMTSANSYQKMGKNFKGARSVKLNWRYLETYDNNRMT